MNNSPRQAISAHAVINKLYSFLNDDIVLVWGLVFLAWILMALIMVTNQHHWSHHHALIAEKSQPLLLVMFTTGVGHLTLMLLLTGVMVAEKTSTWSRMLVPIVGIVLLVWGTLTLLYPLTVA